MRSYILLTVLFGLFPHLSYAQSSAYCEQISSDKNRIVLSSYTPKAGTVYYHDKPNGLVVGGIVMGSVGVASAGVGLIHLWLTALSEPPQQDVYLHRGLAFVVAGGVLGTVGGILIGVGAHKGRSRYSFEIVAPKSNEIGIAWNFAQKK